MAKGGVGCALRCALVCVVPLGAGVCGVQPGIVVTVFSFLSLLFEVTLYALRHQPGKGRNKRVILRPAGFFPLQLVGLYMLQLWCLMLHSASTEPGPAEAVPVAPELPSQGEGLGEGPALAAIAQSRGQLRGAAGSTEAPSPPPLQPKAAAAGEGFQLDAPAEALRWTPKSISVVLPCAEEREYALKTIKSVFEGTPQDVLHEIVVVDDGSEPPLSSTHLPDEVQQKYRVKLMRHPQTVGLIGAKQTGGDAATGDIVVFFDCHVAPQPGWHKDFLELISQNYRRMVVPHITALDVDTWTQKFAGGGLAKCYLTWDADFKWAQSDDMYIPVISGGLLGMSRRWWQETGGYDKEMLGWGGENLDQSLRVWLCGGEIVMAPKAEVAHMWRDGSHKTQARYKRVGDTGRNRARAVYAWYGEFAQKLLDYPAFAHRLQAQAGGAPWYGDLGGFTDVKRRLQGCRSFAWFLRRFRNIYEDGGLLPKEVFMLREEVSGKCLRYNGMAGTSPNGRGTASLHPCDSHDHRLFWHSGNVDPRTKSCCGGLRAWNTDQCIGSVQGKSISTFVCDVAGDNLGQEWAIRDDGLLSHGSRCIGPGSSPDTLSEDNCLSFRTRGGARWTKQSAHEPLETELYRRALEEHPETFRALDAGSRRI